MTKTRTALVAGVFMLLLWQPADAQTPLPPPPQTPYGQPISTMAAKSVAAAAISEAQRNGWKVAIAIVDPGGHLVYFEKMQDTQTGSVALAIEKATTSALFRRPTKWFQDAVAAGNMRMLRLTGTIPNEGGVPIVVDGKLIGAIGVSGASSEQDGQAARVGVESVK